MPNGPGAPSDVGPDGGLVDPAMIGPDGMPADGGPPPDDGGMPPGADGEDAPPPDDEEGGGDDAPPPPPKGKGKKKSSLARYRGVHGQLLTEEQLIRHAAVAATGGDPQVMDRLRRSAVRRTAVSYPGSPGPEMRHTELASGYRVSVGRGPDRSWFAMIHAPEYRQSHLIDLGHSDEFPADRANQALATPHARSFIHATTPRPDAPGNGVTTTVQHSDWWNSPQQRRFQDTPFHSASRRPFADSKKSSIITAMRVEHNHGDMDSDVLRHHMRTQHGMIDTPDDPDWVIDEEHRNQHLDGDDGHVHPDLDSEYGGDIHLGDRDWLGQHGIEASLRRDR